MQKYGRLTILEIIPYHTKNGKPVKKRAKCLCDCGAKKIIDLDHLKGGKTSSCGCLRSINISVGQKFGRLVVKKIFPHHYRDGKRIQSKVECICDCGIIKILFVSGIKHNTRPTRSFGCLVKETNRARSLTHGLSNHYLYRIWRGINTRCYNKNTKGYENYGGRGIVNFWKNDIVSFADYITNELGPRPSNKHSLDRIDNNGNYEPENIRWATQKEQCRNKTHAHQRRIEKLEEQIKLLTEENEKLKKTV